MSPHAENDGNIDRFRTITSGGTILKYGPRGNRVPLRPPQSRCLLEFLFSPPILSHIVLIPCWETNQEHHIKQIQENLIEAEIVTTGLNVDMKSLLLATQCTASLPPLRRTNVQNKNIRINKFFIHLTGVPV